MGAAQCMRDLHKRRQQQQQQQETTTCGIINALNKQKQQLQICLIETTTKACVGVAFRVFQLDLLFNLSGDCNELECFSLE